ncbi:Ig-like domain repeat protein [Rhodococcus sp. NPDC055112]
MRSTRARRAAMIGTAALLLAAPCATLAQAEPTEPASMLPEELVAAIQRDLGISPTQYLERADTGQELATFADTLRGKFPTAYAGAWLDKAGTPLVGLADGPDKAAARTAVEAAGFKVKDQARSENALSDLLGQLNTWIQQLPAPLSGHINGAKVDIANNDIVLGVHDIAGGQGLQLPDFLNFVRVAQEPAQGASDLPGLGSLGSFGSSGPTKPTEPTEPTEPTNPGASTIALDPIKGATAGKEITLKAKVTPAAAGGTVVFEADNFYEEAPVAADGTATQQWFAPETAGKVTMKATFSGRNGVVGSTTTQQVNVAKAATTPTTTKKPTPPAGDAIMGGDAYDYVHAFGGDSHRCTLGFNGTDASGRAVTITAGHCDPADPDVAGTDNASSGHEVVGGVRGERFGEAVKTAKAPMRLDYSVIKIDDNFAKRFENNYVRVPGKAPLAITGTADPVEGAPVCMSGMVTGYHCGTLKAAVAGDDRGNHTTGRFTVRICGLGGDSGSPMFTGTKALGISAQSSVTSGQQSECDLWETMPDISDFYRPTVWVTPIKEILKENPGLKIRTN